MSWLIEAYTGEILDEAPIDDYVHTTQRTMSKLKHAGKISDKDIEKADEGKFGAMYKVAYQGAKAGQEAGKNKAVKKAIEHKYGKAGIKDNIKDYKAMKNGDEETTNKYISKANDTIVAKDALDRHNRRHPDRAVGEDADLLA